MPLDPIYKCIHVEQVYSIQMFVDGAWAEVDTTEDRVAALRRFVENVADNDAAIVRVVQMETIHKVIVQQGKEADHGAELGSK